MLTREEIKQYAIDICIPLMERNAKRMQNGEYALKPDAVGYFWKTFAVRFGDWRPSLRRERSCILP